MNKKEKINTENINETVSLTKKVLKIIYLLLILAVIAIGLFLLKEINILPILGGIIKIASPLFIGIVIAWLFDPLVNWLNKKGVHRILGAIVAFLLLIIFIVLFFTLLLPVLIEQINDFVNTLPSIFSSVTSWIESAFDNLSASGVDLTSAKESIFKNIENVSVNLTSDMPKTILSIVSSLVSGIGIFSIGLIIGFYLLIDFDGIKHCLDFLPKRIHQPITTILLRLNDTLRDFVQGTLFISLIMAVLTFIGFWIIGLKSPVLFALIVGITNVIPYIGPWLGGAIAALVGFTISPLTGVLTILVAFIAQQLDSIIIQPLVMGKTMKLHPVTIVVGLLIFGYLGGILGMILATPIISGIKIILNFFDEKYQIWKKIKSEIKDLGKKEKEVVKE